MLDWKQYVHEHLPLLRLPGPRELDIIEELAQQLEQAYAEVLAQGANEEEAEAYAGSQFPDWRALAREIEQAEQPVNGGLTEAVRARLAFLNLLL